MVDAQGLRIPVVFPDYATLEERKSMPSPFLYTWKTENGDRGLLRFFKAYGDRIYFITLGPDFPAYSTVGIGRVTVVDNKWFWELRNANSLRAEGVILEDGSLKGDVFTNGTKLPMEVTPLFPPYRYTPTLGSFYSLSDQALSDALIRAGGEVQNLFIPTGVRRSAYGPGRTILDLVK